VLNRVSIFRLADVLRMADVFRICTSLLFFFFVLLRGANEEGNGGTNGWEMGEMSSPTCQGGRKHGQIVCLFPGSPAGRGPRQLQQSCLLSHDPEAAAHCGNCAAKGLAACYAPGLLVPPSLPPIPPLPPPSASSTPAPLTTARAQSRLLAWALFGNLVWVSRVSKLSSARYAWRACGCVSRGCFSPGTHSGLSLPSLLGVRQRGSICCVCSNCVCVCVHTHTHTHTRAHARTHARTHTHTHTCCAAEHGPKRHSREDQELLP
jgi:hypothetical protein